ncbi:MAG: helix-turn-helix transcriptional regulator [Treponema sp.]|uniref:helix-turn-helix domain-containing protein n=1 Tax=Treponema sp. TaxID=166 RepID=UPI0025E828E2|nr:helix-turn-helix transcriptional regulator [Treponema sp.]MBQ9280596.1 helix-turn-helix transcriptional regulator [Treponema sp.]
MCMSKPLETVFRENLRFYRQKAKLSQEKLSALLDKNINYITIIESGKSLPPITMIEQIAEILRVEPKCFFDPLEKNEKKFFDKEAFIAQAKEQIAKSAEEVLQTLLQTSPISAIISS